MLSAFIAGLQLCHYGMILSRLTPLNNDSAYDEQCL